jgi:lipoprotein-anchoring transpeptidase ErfK/SrfK
MCTYGGVAMMRRLSVLAVMVFAATPVSAETMGSWGMWGEKQTRAGGGGSSSGGGSWGGGSPSWQAPKPKPQPSYVGAPPPKPKAAVAAADTKPKPPVELMEGGPKPAISPQTPPVVAFANGYGSGTVVIDTAARKLYYTLSNTQAYAYSVAVGKEGFDWTGTEKVSRIASWPDWNPPAEMRQRKPELPLKMTGGLYNPLGAKAIYLGDTLYRIHGTNDAKSIGTASSSGCFRMSNASVVHLAGLVGPGTTVHVVKSLPKNVAGGENSNKS